MAVDPCQGVDGLGIIPSDQDPIRSLQISDRRALCQKLGIGQHGKAAFRSGILSCRKDGLNRCSCAHRERALLNNDRVSGGCLGHGSRAGLNPAQVTGLACPESLGLGGSVDGNEHHVRRCNRRLNLCGKGQIATSGSCHHCIETGLINRKKAEIISIPGINPCLIQIHHRDLNLRAAIGNHRHRRTTDITRSDAADSLNRHSASMPPVPRTLRKDSMVGSSPCSSDTVGCQLSCSRARSING